MESKNARAAFVAVLGTLIGAASLAVLVWDPGGDMSGVIGFILVVLTVLGAGLVVAGASKLLRDEGPDQADS